MAIQGEAVAHSQLVGGAQTSLHSHSGGGGGPTAIYKPSDQSKTSDTTLADDSYLKFSVSANTKYWFSIFVYFNTGATGDFKYTLTGPSSPTKINYQSKRIAHGGTSWSAASRRFVFGNSDSVTASVSGDGYVEIDGMLDNGSNGGTLAFQWAQNTSDTTATKVYQGSYLIYGII